MISMRIMIVLSLLGVAIADPLTAQDQAKKPPSACAAMNGYSFVCGVQNPEDLAPIPGTRWLIASDRKLGNSIKLIDTDAKLARDFFTGDPAQIRPNRELFPNCPEVLDAHKWVSHGLFLKPKGGGRYVLYVVDDRPLQSVQIFDVAVNGGQPSLTWAGCVPLPSANKAYANLGAASTSERLDPNAVAAFSDGTILVSVPRRPGTTPVQRFNGSPTGDILEWKPGDEGFHVIQGAQVAYANGIEISPDESEFYVAAYSEEKVYIFSRRDPLRPIRQVKTPGFMPDNLRWSGDRLIVAGMMFDEPSCGGTQLELNGSPSQFGCHRGFMFAQLDPNSMTWKMLAYSEPHPEFNVVATGVVIGDTLWVGASSADGVPYRPLPHLASERRPGGN